MNSVGINQWQLVFNNIRESTLHIDSIFRTDNSPYVLLKRRQQKDRHIHLLHSSHISQQMWSMWNASGRLWQKAEGILFTEILHMFSPIYSALLFHDHLHHLHQDKHSNTLPFRGTLEQYQVSPCDMIKDKRLTALARHIIKRGGHIARIEIIWYDIY